MQKNKLPLKQTTAVNAMMPKKTALALAVATMLWGGNVLAVNASLQYSTTDDTGDDEIRELKYWGNSGGLGGDSYIGTYRTVCDNNGDNCSETYLNDKAIKLDNTGNQINMASGTLGGGTVNMGDGDDTFNISTGNSSIPNNHPKTTLHGTINMGAGDDTVNLNGTSNSSSVIIDLGSGTDTVTVYGPATAGYTGDATTVGKITSSSGTNTINVEEGATLNGQIDLTGNNTINVKEGSTVQSSSQTIKLGGTNTVNTDATVANIKSTAGDSNVTLKDGSTLTENIALQGVDNTVVVEAGAQLTGIGNGDGNITTDGTVSNTVTLEEGAIVRNVTMNTANATNKLDVNADATVNDINVTGGKNTIFVHETANVGGNIAVTGTENYVDIDALIAGTVTVTGVGAANSDVIVEAGKTVEQGIKVAGNDVDSTAVIAIEGVNADGNLGTVKGVIESVAGSNDIAFAEGAVLEKSAADVAGINLEGSAGTDNQVTFNGQDMTAVTVMKGSDVATNNTLVLEGVNWDQNDNDPAIFTAENDMTGWRTVALNNGELTFQDGDKLTVGDINTALNTDPDANTDNMFEAKDSTVNVSNFELDGNMQLRHSQLNVLDGDMEITGDLLMNPSIIDMQNGVAGQTTTVGGDWIIANGDQQLLIDTDFAAVLSDNMDVTGDFVNDDGHKVIIDVNNVTSGKAKKEDVLVVATGSEIADPSKFVLSGGKTQINQAIYKYKLGAADGADVNSDIYLKYSGFNALGATYTAAGAALSDAFASLPTMEQRVGQRSMLTRSAGGITDGIWVRFLGNKSETTPRSGELGYQIDSSVYGLQIGSDFNLATSDSSNLVFGVSGIYKSMDADIKVSDGQGKIEADGYGLGLSLTWTNNIGTYVDGQLQYMSISSDLGAYGETPLKGQKSDSIAASVEAGHRMIVGDSGKNALVPQAQLYYSNFESSRKTDTYDLAVKTKVDDSVKLRLGVAFEHHPDGVNLAKPNSNKIYGIVSLSEDFGGKYSTQIDDDVLKGEKETTWAEIGVGGSYKLTQNAALYGEAGYKQAISAKESPNNDFGVTAGVRVTF